MRKDTTALLGDFVKCVDKARQSGSSDSVFLTLKRHLDRKDPTQKPACLVRLKTRSKKVSSLVQKEAVADFSGRLSTVLRGELDGLKKKDKKKARKKKNATPADSSESKPRK